MSAHSTVAVIVGSLRKGSHTRRIAQALMSVAPASLSFRMIEIGDLPLYNEDLDDRPPAPWVRLRQELSGADGVLFLTPEYNRSIPGCLKNAIDVGSRPPGKNVYNALPAGIVSVTPYKLGALGANHALRQSLVYINMPVMQQPEAYIAAAGEILDESGQPKTAETREFFRTFMEAFARWVEVAGAGRRAERNFEQFMDQRSAVANAYAQGNPAPLDEIVARTGPATFFGPGGGYVTGAGEVQTRYDRDAKAFSPDGASSLDVLQSEAAGDLAFWTGFQNVEAHLGDNPEPVTMKLRVTELFRYADGGWKLVHRHADSASSPH